MNTTRIAILATSLTLGAAAAHAGGYVPPVIETAPAPVVLDAPVGSWQGGYAGLTLGYAFGGEDRVGLSDTATDTLLGDIGELKVKGANAGVRAGYRWQRESGCSWQDFLVAVAVAVAVVCGAWCSLILACGQ